MTASQDKVQSIIQSLLEDSLPLVHKGVFSQQQLQQAMCAREKLQNNMLKPTFKLSDYLKAIQFQYELERKRRYKIKQLVTTNPLFKKSAKTDFVIIKRIIKLWDRTMHKFKYDIQLWKQYLAFCVQSQSKKQFYKALSFALRFVPFSQDLWLIGVNYQIQIGMNMWKARKLFIKAVKMNSKKIRLWVEMFKFQMMFLKTIHEREKAIEGNQKMNIINEKQDEQQQSEQNDKMDNQQDDQNAKKYDEINLQQHDDVLLLVFQEAVSKINQQNKNDFINQINKLLQISIKQQHDKFISLILKRAQKRIKQMLQKEQIICIKKQPISSTKRNLQQIPSSIQQKIQYYKQYLTETKQLTAQELDKIVCQFLTKPQYLAQLLTFFIHKKKHLSIKLLQQCKTFKISNLPPKIIQCLIKNIYQFHQIADYKQMITKIIQKINPSAYVQYLSLLEWVIKINKKLHNFKINSDIHRSVSVLCKNRPEIVERCVYWIHKKQDDDDL